MTRLERTAVQAEIDANLETDGGVALADRLFELEMAIISDAVVPSDTFEFLLALLDDPRLLSHPQANHVVNFFEFTWDRINIPQQGSLLLALERSWPMFVDQQARFVISELLGMCYATEAVIPVLCRLMLIPSEESQRNVIHAFGHLVTEGKQEGLLEKSRQHVRELLTRSKQADRRLPYKALSEFLDRLAADPPSGWL